MDPRNRIHHCFYCEEYFNSKNDLIQHRREFHNLRTLQDLRSIQEQQESDLEYAISLQMQEYSMRNIIPEEEEPRRNVFNVLNVLIPNRVETYQELRNSVSLTAPVSPIVYKSRKMKNDLPNHIAKMLADKAGKCPICITEITVNDICISFCGHIYCQDCLKNVKEKTAKCAVCRESFYDDE